MKASTQAYYKLSNMTITELNEHSDAAQYVPLTTDSEYFDHSNQQEHTFTTTTVQELGILLKLSIPLNLTYLLRYSIGFTSISLISIDGPSSVAALSLGNAIAATTGFALVDGLAGGLDTVFSHAHGSRRYHVIGIYAQKFCCLAFLACICVAILWSFSSTILEGWVADPNVTKLCCSYLRVLILALPGYVLFEVAKRWVLAMGHSSLPLYASLITTPMQYLLCYFLVRHLRWGIHGVATANIIYHTLNPLLLLLLVRYTKPQCFICWPGFSKLALQDWKPLMSFCLPCMVTMEVEWIMYDILSYSASYLPGVADSAFSIIAVLSSVLYQIPLSTSICASLRLGELLGQGQTKAVPQVLRLYTIFGSSIGLMNGVFLMGLKDVFVPFFTKSRQVQALIRSTWLLFGTVALFDATTAMTNGFIRGVGKQRIGVWFNLVGQFPFAIPLALFLALGPPRSEMVGLWTGVACGAFFITCGQGLYLWRRRHDLSGLVL